MSDDLNQGAGWGALSQQLTSVISALLQLDVVADKTITWKSVGAFLECTE